MAHLVETMFSVKERPWHGIGTIVTQAPTIEEGIRLAGLDWTVSLQDIQWAEGNLDQYKAVMRDDTKTCLGIVSNKYTPLQNIDAFKFFEPFVDNEFISLETAGCLDEGRRIWVLAKVNGDDMLIDEDDRVEKYLLLSNTHNATSAIKVGYCAIRVVCNNTLTAAESNVNSQLIKIHHRGDVIQSLDMVRDIMNVVNASFQTTEKMYKQLVAKTNICTADIEKYVKAVFSTEALEKSFNDNTALSAIELKLERKKLAQRVEELFASESKHNAWTLYNSFNYVLNHERGKDSRATYNSLWFGTGPGSYKQLDRKALKQMVLL